MLGLPLLMMLPVKEGTRQEQETEKGLLFVKSSRYIISKTESNFLSLRQSS